MRQTTYYLVTFHALLGSNTTHARHQGSVQQPITQQLHFKPHPPRHAIPRPQSAPLAPPPGKHARMDFRDHPDSVCRHPPLPHLRNAQNQKPR